MHYSWCSFISKGVLLSFFFFKELNTDFGQKGERNSLSRTRVVFAVYTKEPLVIVSNWFRRSNRMETLTVELFTIIPKKKKKDKNK